MYTTFILFRDTKPQATFQKIKHNLYCYKLRHYTWGASRFCNIHVLLSSIAPFLEGILCPDVMLTTYRFGIHFKLIGRCTQQRIICRSKIDFTSGDAGFDTRRIYTFMNERLHERWRRSWLPEKFPRKDFNRNSLQSIKCTSTGIDLSTARVKPRPPISREVTPPKSVIKLATRIGTLEDIHKDFGPNYMKCFYCYHVLFKMC